MFILSITHSQISQQVCFSMRVRDVIVQYSNISRGSTSCRDMIDSALQLYLCEA